MAGSRTLKLSILADVDDLKKNLKAGSDDVESFGDKAGEFGKKAAAAFAVAAAAAVAYAGKLAVDGVKAAIEDQAAQEKLANSLRNVTGATDKQIAAVEEQVTKMSLAYGVADDQLRPAFQRLATATGNLDEANKGLSLALDISAATGKSVEAVSNALGKAYEGNTASLGRLGIGLSSAELKSMSLEQVTQRLSDVFGGAAATQANTFQGRIDRMKIAFDEAKETIGFAFLPIIEKVLTFVTDKIVPAFTTFSNALSGKSGSIQDNFESVGKVISTVFLPIFERAQETFTVVWKLLKDNFTPVLDAFKEAWVKVSTALEGQKENIGDLLDSLQEVYEWLAKTLIPLVRVVLVAAFKVAGESLATAFDVLIPVFKNVASFVKTYINQIIDNVNLVIKAINLLKPGEDIKLVPKIGDKTETQTAFEKTGFADFKLGSMPAPNASVVSNPSPNVVVNSTSSGTGGGQSAAAPAAAPKKVESDTKVLGDMPDIFQQVAEANAIKYAAPGVFDPSAVKRADQVNIVINGAVDPAGTARQVADILKNEASQSGTFIGIGQSRFSPRAD